MSNKRMFSWGTWPVAMVLLLCATLRIHAQSASGTGSHEVDLAFTYDVARQNGTPGPTFWQQGGAAELSATFYRGWGAAMLLSGGIAHNANNSGVDVKTINIVFGPRYTFTRGKWAVFGEGLIGESNGFGGVYPSSRGALAAFDTFALQAGGGVDFRLSRHVAVRPLQAYWLRTEFPNATTNIQNGMEIGAGIVLRLQR